MVNLYDNYQQSKVMNLIPDNSRALLKQQGQGMKDQAVVEKEINDMYNKYNFPLASKIDAAKVATKFESYAKVADGLVNNENLSPDEKLVGILKVNRAVKSDKEISDIAESNKVMLEEKKKVAPSLRPYMERNVFPGLETPNDGTIWSGDFSMDPDKEWAAAQSELRNAVSAQDVPGTKGKEEGVSSVDVESYMKKNVFDLLNSKKGIAVQMADMYENSTGTKLDPNNPDQVRQLTGMTLDVWRDKNSEYSYNKSKGKGNSTVINFNQKSPVPATGVLMKEPGMVNYLSGLSSRFGLGPDKITGDAQYTEIAKQAESSFKSGFDRAGSSVILTNNFFASDPSHAKDTWSSGANFVSKAIFTKESTQVSQGSALRTSSDVGETAKDIVMYPDIPYGGLFVSGPSRSSELYLGNGTVDILRRASRDKKIFMEPGTVNAQYSIMSDGALGSVARVNLLASDTLGDTGVLVDAKGNKKNGVISIAQSLFEKIKVSNNSTAWDLISNAKTDIVKIHVADGVELVVLVKPIEVAGKMERSYSFDVIKSSAPLYGPSLRSLMFNMTKGKPSTTEQGGAYTVSQSNTPSN